MWNIIVIITLIAIITTPIWLRYLLNHTIYKDNKSIINPFNNENQELDKPTTINIQPSKIPESEINNILIAVAKHNKNKELNNSDGEIAIDDLEIDEDFLKYLTTKFSDKSEQILIHFNSENGGYWSC
jgi:hypothetical protein